ncbi:MAG: GNAT family N-acetyltransferase [Litoreibacter sp.]|nr:GNAT family N-acetyltransferase [Litoreibacter sp.]
MARPEISVIDGIRLRLRLVTLDDAAYIHALRRDPKYNSYLSAYQGTVDTQRAWLEAYKQRESAGAEFYYVIERRDKTQPCGVVRLYEITQESFTWGSWILDHRKPAKAALESATLSFGVGFEQLGLPKALVDVRNNNVKARAIYERFGMRYLRHTSLDTYFEYSAEQYFSDLDHHMSILRNG